MQKCGNHLLRFHHAMIYLTIVFLLRVRSRMLCAQWTCHVLWTRLPCIPRSPYHVPPARVLVRFCSRFMCSLTCTNMDCRLVSLRLLLMLVSFCFIDSSLAYLLWTVDSSVVRHSSHFPFLYICNCTRSPLYIRVGDGDYSPSSIYFATTLKVWPARSHKLSSSSLVRWPRLLLCVS